MNPPWRPDAPANLVKLAVGRCLVAVMDGSKWTELGLFTDTADATESHPRLLRSLRFGDEDYDGHVFNLVPVLLDEHPDPQVDAWDPVPQALEPLTLHARFPNLAGVAEFIDLPAWLAENDESMFRRLFDDAADATLPDGTVLSAAAAAAARLEVNEMRRQVERIRRDHSTDPEAAIGQAKELIETVCKTILGMTGDAVEAGVVKFPQLVKRTMLDLGIDPSQMQGGAPDGVQVRASKQVLGGIASVLNGADELRNARGTGHGRSRSTLVDGALARLAVGAALPAAIYLIETYESRTRRDAAPVLVERSRPMPTDIEVGAVVRHQTYGEGQVTATSGEGRNLVISVDFGADVGRKRLLVGYSGLTVVR